MPQTSDRLLVLGGTGLLGSKVVAEAVRRGYSVNAPKRTEFDLLINGRTVSLLSTNTSVKAVINCAGAIPQRNPSIDTIIKLNAYLPHKIAQWAETYAIPVYHISTDCVFSGNSGYNSVESNPDPTDVYGRSKLLGEVNSLWVHNIRTSFIGFGGIGLLEWLVKHKNDKEVYGWSEAYWSGTSTAILAEAILDSIEREFRTLNNIEHFAIREGVSKYKLLCMLNETLKLGINIIPISKPKVYRTLQPTVILPPIEKAVEELAKEYYSMKIAS